MKYLLIFFTISLHANFFLDNINLYLAQKSYKNKEYKKALEYAKKIPKNDKIYLFIGNCYYHLAQFDKALLAFNKIKELNFIKNYNMANCYFKLKKFYKARNFYQNALKFKKDANALSNLSLTKQYIKKQELLIRQNAKNKPKSKNKDQGLCRLFEGSNPLFMDDNKSFYGTLAKFKSNKAFLDNLAKSTATNHELKSTFYNAKTQNKKTTMPSNSLQEYRIEKKFNSLKNDTLLIPLLKEENE